MDESAHEPPCWGKDASFQCAAPRSSTDARLLVGRDRERPVLLGPVAPPREHGSGSHHLSRQPQRRSQAAGPAVNRVGQASANNSAISRQLAFTTTRTVWPVLLRQPLGLELLDDRAPSAVVVAAVPVTSQARPRTMVAYRLSILPPAPQALLAPVTQMLPGLGTSKRHGETRGCLPYASNGIWIGGERHGRGAKQHRPDGQRSGSSIRAPARPPPGSRGCRQTSSSVSQPPPNATCATGCGTRATPLASARRCGSRAARGEPQIGHARPCPPMSLRSRSWLWRVSCGQRLLTATGRQRARVFGLCR